MIYATGDLQSPANGRGSLCVGIIWEITEAEVRDVLQLRGA